MTLFLNTRVYSSSWEFTTGTFKDQYSIPFGRPFHTSGWGHPLYGRLGEMGLLLGQKGDATHYMVYV